MKDLHQGILEIFVEAQHFGAPKSWKDSFGFHITAKYQDPKEHALYQRQRRKKPDAHAAELEATRARIAARKKALVEAHAKTLAGAA